MIVETEVGFSDRLGNSFVETLQCYVDDEADERNVEAVIEDTINEWFLKTARETFDAEFPFLKDADEDEYMNVFINYFYDAELYSDLD